MECWIKLINVGLVQCQDIPVPALHAHRSLAETRSCSGTLRTLGSLMEDLFEVRITQGLFPAGLVQSLMLNNTCIKTYSPVLQVTLLEEHFTPPIPKNTLPFRDKWRKTPRTRTSGADQAGGDATPRAGTSGIGGDRSPWTGSSEAGLARKRACHRLFSNTTVQRRTILRHSLRSCHAPWLAIDIRDGLVRAECTSLHLPAHITAMVLSPLGTVRCGKAMRYTHRRIPQPPDWSVQGKVAARS